MFNYPLDSDYMTFEEYLTRLRKDLNNPDFAVLDDRAAESEEEYQVKLALFKKVLKKDCD
ncbi:hypothetical protein VC81_03960 [Levilactobacillus spicheri]|uniref:Uncharacterized protein n=1 Tax=Levilactobacillus spicheri TaxID=216463 RepID=A0A0F3RS78_9LACO|nr:hypothetical protein VC81_06150 [Levilactobacillus spicheri]KJW13617.1 hypothetical protein VC81_03960 [Levilactobacillus spicheri]